MLNVGGGYYVEIMIPTHSRSPDWERGEEASPIALVSLPNLGVPTDFRGVRTPCDPPGSASACSVDIADLIIKK